MENGKSVTNVYPNKTFLGTFGSLFVFCIVPLHLDVVARLLAALERRVQVGLTDRLVDVLLLEAHHLLYGFILREGEKYFTSL